MASRPTGKHAAPREHRLPRVPLSGARAPGRHRRVSPPSTFRRNAPRIVGATALAVAATGALTGAEAPPASSQVVTTDLAAAARISPDLTARLIAERQVRISRDSSRQALARAAGDRAGTAGGGQARERNAGVAKLAASAERAAAKLAKDAWLLPLAPGSYRLTARFGQCSSLWSHCHTGLDFAAPEGTPVRSVAGGVVAEAGYAGAYGNRVIVRLEDGTELWYCHLSQIGVGAGSAVAGGQILGAVGSTGNSTGPHLHLEVRPGGGDPVDPYHALVARGITP